MTNAANIDNILHGAAFAPIERGFLRITGPDATRWLNGMVTNNIKDLAPGCGNYNFLLNAQGRILGDCTLYHEGPATYLLETDNWQLEAVQHTLDKFIIMDDVELAVVEGLSGVLVAGPKALSIIAALGTDNQQAAPCASPDAAPAPQGISLKQTTYGSAPVSLIAAHSPVVPQFEIWSGPATIAGILAELGATAAVPASPETLEAFRIYSGTPKYGIDIRNTDTARDLPQETALNGGQSHALNFNKGCYLGQEIVERIHSRGQVHRTFTRFTLTGQLPAELPVSLEANGKPAGELTSAARIHTAEHGERIYALGYARREALDTRAIFTYPGGTAVPLIPNP